jgi:A/G-specific adenine glycosylase
MTEICEAFKKDQVALIPYQTKKKKSLEFQSEMLFIRAGEYVLFRKRPPQGIWGGLWSFPESAWVKISPNQIVPHLDLPEVYSNIFQDISLTDYKNGKVLAPRKHIFTHRVLYFQIRVIQIDSLHQAIPKDMRWIKLDQIKTLGLPTPVRQFLTDYLQITF